MGDGFVEYVWVQRGHGSKGRMEGRLAVSILQILDSDFVRY